MFLGVSVFKRNWEIVFLDYIKDMGCFVLFCFIRNFIRGEMGIVKNKNILVLIEIRWFILLSRFIF